MSGPYCGTCKHFKAGWRNAVEGECLDPAKVIYFARAGDRSNEPSTVVADVHTCRNHTPLAEREKGAGKS